MDNIEWLESIKIKKAQLEKEQMGAFQQQALLEQKLDQIKASTLRLEGGIIVLKELIDLIQVNFEPNDQHSLPDVDLVETLNKQG